MLLSGQHLHNPSTNRLAIKAHPGPSHPGFFCNEEPEKWERETIATRVAQRRVRIDVNDVNMNVVRFVHRCVHVSIYLISIEDDCGQLPCHQ